ncbi:hypothetical protein BABINDRAFT_75455 [Babjeviella inositovora NRRL Y-12698]|uniref:Uncharacterized protein n=1 Tax=Babjeviella inositovora NRRL Y-12698 TaxID=984486 RepID=A0A1E3QYJ2_9ASCO|nr:uncharacterized protein BABINDRAFT_75455 [Babjeviella inositovora NRRL Y-12698]ODQ82723.1 hypothetical protein BABINDRAFT_75455 [Babjeviella inositovora NRRL Y-12698]
MSKTPILYPAHATPRFPPYRRLSVRLFAGTRFTNFKVSDNAIPKGPAEGYRLKFVATGVTYMPITFPRRFILLGKWQGFEKPRCKGYLSHELRKRAQALPVYHIGGLTCDGLFSIITADRNVPGFGFRPFCPSLVSFG